MKYENLKRRTKTFALDIIRLVDGCPKDEATRVLRMQLLRSGTSVGANYRAACRAKSPADFANRMGTVEEEADETGYWLELLVASEKIRAGDAEPLIREASELTAIAVASINTSRSQAARKAKPLKPE